MTTAVVSTPSDEVTTQTSYVSRWIAQTHGNYHRKSNEFYSSSSASSSCESQPSISKGSLSSQSTTTWQAQAKSRLNISTNHNLSDISSGMHDKNDLQDKLHRIRVLLNAKKQRLCRHLSSTSTSYSMTNPLQDQVPDSTVVGDHLTSPPLLPLPSSSSLVLDNVYHSHDGSISSSTSPHIYTHCRHRQSSPTILPCLMEESPSDSGLSDGTKTTHPDDIHEPITKNSAIIDLSKPLSKEEMLAIIQIIRELWKKQFDCDMPDMEDKIPIPTTSFKHIGEMNNLAEKNRAQYRSTPALNKLNAELNDIKDKLKRFSTERIQTPLVEEKTFESLDHDEPSFVSLNGPLNTQDLERLQSKKDTLLRRHMQRREEQLMKKNERQSEANQRHDEYRLFEEYLSQRRQQTNEHRSNILQAHLEQKRFESDPLSTNDYYFAAAQNRQRLKRKSSLSSFVSFDDDLSYSSSINHFQTPKRSLTRFDVMSPSLTAPTKASESKMNRAASSCNIHRGYYDSSTSLNYKGTARTTNLLGGSLMNLSKVQTPKGKSTSFIDEIFDDTQFTASMTSLNTSIPGSRFARNPSLLSTKSNRQTIVNSLKQVVLAGQPNERQREIIIREIESSEARHFVILFRDHRLQFRAIYMYIPETDIIEKIHGIGPNIITEIMVDKWFKYNSGGKRFTNIPIRHFSIQCDAVIIHNEFWQKKSSSINNINKLH